MQKKPAPLVAMDFDLAAGDEFVAAGANAAVIQRRPFPPPVSGAQNVEAIFRGEMLLHAFTKAVARSFAIGCRDERRIRESLTNAASPVTLSAS